MASFIVCPILPFPNIYWWSFALQSSKILLDEHEHFEKMSFRNRYMLAGANGVITLSIPLQEGRQQRKPMSEIKICNKTDWQKVHWRTLQSVYNRSPYFEFYKNETKSGVTGGIGAIGSAMFNSPDEVAILLAKDVK
jgi:hypothetical protein